MVWITGVDQILYFLCYHGLLQRCLDENFWLGCLYWYFCPCLALCQETAHVGQMDGYIPNEISEAERQTKSSVHAK